MLGYGGSFLPATAYALAYAGKRDDARRALQASIHGFGGDLMPKLTAQLQTAVLLGEASIAATSVERLRQLSAMIDMQGGTGSIARLLGDAEALLGHPRPGLGLLR